MKGGRKFDQERKEPWRWTLMITSDKSASRKSVHRLTELEGVLMTRFTALCATRLGRLFGMRSRTGYAAGCDRVLTSLRVD